MRNRIYGLFFALGLAACSDKPSAAAQSQISSSPDFPGCSRDTDCKGDRICENKVCVTPSASTSRIKQTAKNSSAASIRALEDQLRCLENPQPGKALLALIDNRLLSEPTEYMDGVPNLIPIGDLKLFGRSVVSIHGFEDNEPKGRAAELFPRGPGTSPGYFISVVLDAKPADVEYTAVTRPEDDYESPHSTISEQWDDPGKTEIQCNGH